MEKLAKNFFINGILIILLFFVWDLISYFFLNEVFFIKTIIGIILGLIMISVSKQLQK